MPPMILISHPWYSLLVVAIIFVVFQSFRRIGPTDVGLVTKRFAWKKLSADSPVAFDGEAGFNPDHWQQHPHGNTRRHSHPHVYPHALAYRYLHPPVAYIRGSRAHRQRPARRLHGVEQ